MILTSKMIRGISQMILKPKKATTSDIMILKISDKQCIIEHNIIIYIRVELLGRKNGRSAKVLVMKSLGALS